MNPLSRSETTSNRFTGEAPRLLLSVLLSVSLATSALHAKGVSTSAGLTLLTAPTARVTGLAESFTAEVDDIAAMSYNPASLDLLGSGQASFLYQKGLADDNYGHYMMGMPS